jgi:hypothetical protein
MGKVSFWHPGPSVSVERLVAHHIKTMRRESRDEPVGSNRKSIFRRVP